MWLNSTAQNALRAVLHIAEHAADGPVRVDDIAASLRCPRNYLSKTLHALTRAGVLRSARGPKGGFQLVDPPNRLALARVVGPFEPTGERRCLVGRADCGDAHPCPAHYRWSRVAAVVEDFFGQTTVADLLKQDTRSHAT
jgi:Rrf2 family iron-sulfur cluster assembly transcriptional regulator